MCSTKAKDLVVAMGSREDRLVRLRRRWNVRFQIKDQGPIATLSGHSQKQPDRDLTLVPYVPKCWVGPQASERTRVRYRPRGLRRCLALMQFDAGLRIRITGPVRRNRRVRQAHSQPNVVSV
jgi:hypothetical protein